MASMPPAAPTPRHLMSLGMFVFGMDTLPYQELTFSMGWRHAKIERHQAPAATQFLGPDIDTISIAGLLVPEIAGDASAFDTLEAMGELGSEYPLLDGLGKIYGYFTILRIDRDHLGVMAGGIPRHTGFRIELERVD